MAQNIATWVWNRRYHVIQTEKENTFHKIKKKKGKCELGCFMVPTSQKQSKSKTSRTARGRVPSIWLSSESILFTFLCPVMKALLKLWVSAGGHIAAHIKPMSKPFAQRLAFTLDQVWAYLSNWPWHNMKSSLTLRYYTGFNPSWSGTVLTRMKPDKSKFSYLINRQQILIAKYG